MNQTITHGSFLKWRVFSIVLSVMLPGLIAQPCIVHGAVRFIVTGDTRGSDNGVNTVILSETVQATIDEAADFILVTGDLVNESSSQSELESQLTTWLNTMAPLYNAGIGVYPCRGNHDAGSKAAWDNVFSGNYALPDNGPSGEKNITFSFAYDNVFIVALDQIVSEYRVNQTWLNTQFNSNTKPHVFVFGHYPAFKVNHSDCLDDYPSNRNTFWNSLAAEGERIYFTGHDHFYDHARLDDGDGDPRNDVHQFIVGSGGAPPYSDGAYDGNNGPWNPVRIYHEEQYGYVLVEVNDLNVTVTWKARTAPGVYEATGDEFTYTVGDSGRRDDCPNDDNKIDPGICGCGFPDIDSDGDGTLDCNDTDDDNDGISDATEASGPNSGDANNDGFQDSLQRNVASIDSYSARANVVIESPNGTTLSGCQAVGNPSPDDAPAGIDFNYGFFNFTINKISAGGNTTLTMTLPGGAAPDTYYKYGKTSVDPADHWYEFLYNGQTGAEINGNVITLHLVDALEGDDNLTRDSMIIDLGGPGFVSANNDNNSSKDGGGSGGGCFIDSLYF